jgi:NTP pyrophosphatase (non-canonical NTP hydrolase)
MTTRDMNRVARACADDSRRWFPEVHSHYQRQIVHLALGLGGEVGELLNLVKKVNRGQSDLFADNLDKVSVELGEELADVLIYALILAHVAGYDPANLIFQKRIKNEQRFGHQATEKEHRR